MTIRTVACAAVLLLAGAVALQSAGPLAADAGKFTKATVKGYVLDSACAFIKDLAKPVSPDCAVACANAGSPLVILGEDGVLYWPIGDTMPATGQNARLLPFAGQKVTASGKLYQRGGSHAIVLETIEPLAGAR